MSTLVERAKRTRSKSQMKIKRAHIELALAWARGEVSGAAVRNVLGLKDGGQYAILARALREHLQSKEV